MMHVRQLGKAYIECAVCCLQFMELCSVKLRRVAKLIILNLRDNIVISVHSGQFVEEVEPLAE